MSVALPAGSPGLVLRERPSLLAIAIPVLLAVQSSGFVLLRAHQVLDECDSIVLFWNEILKMAVALGMSIRHRRSLAEYASGLHVALFPVGCFTAMNLLSFWSLKRIPASLSAILIQLKLVFAALFVWLFLGTRVSASRAFAIVAIFLGCAAVAVLSRQEGELGGGGEEVGLGGVASQERMLAVLGLVMEAMLSGLAAVYMQSIFNMSLDTMWVRNVQLALISALVYLGNAWRAVSAPNAFWALAGPGAGGEVCSLRMSGEGWVLAAVSASGGVLVALSLLYVGAVGKAVATGASIALTLVLEHLMMLRRWPTLLQTLLALAVLNGVAQYSADGLPPPPPAPVAPADPGSTRGGAGGRAKREPGMGTSSAPADSCSPGAKAML